MPPDDTNKPNMSEALKKALQEAAAESKALEESLLGGKKILDSQFNSWTQIAALSGDVNKQQELINQAIDEELGKKKDLLLQEELELENIKIKLKVNEAAQAVNNKLLEDEQRKLDIGESLLRQSLDLKEESEKEKQALEDINKLLDKKFEKIEDAKKALKEKNDTLKKTVKGRENEGKTLDKSNQLLIRTAANQERVASAAREGANAGDELAKKFLGISQQTQSMIGNMLEVEGSVGRFAKNLFDSKKQFDALAAKAEEFAMNLGRQVMGMVLSVDQAMVDLTRSTGQLDRSFEEEITGIVAAGEAMGITYEEAAGAYGELFASSKGFVTLSKTQQVEAGKQATQFAKLGVSTQAYGSMLDTVTKTFRQSVGETKALTTRFVNLSGVLGRLPNDVINEFNDSLSVLARNGPDAVGQFEKLAMVARQAGTDVNTLLGITKQFETFGSASEAVGTLNAMLGGPFLNTMEMVNASFDDPAKTIELLSNAVNRSGQSFASMDAAMKQAIASQAGISDMSIAERLFGGEITYQQLQEEMANTSVSFEKLGENASTNLSISETLNMILQDTFRQLSASGVDVGQMFKDMATALRKVIEFMNEWGGSSIMKFGLMAIAFSPLLNMFGGLVGMLFGGGGARLGAIAGMKSLGDASKSAALQSQSALRNIGMAARGMIAGVAGAMAASGLATAMGAEEGGLGQGLAALGGGALAGLASGGIPGLIAGTIGGAAVAIKSQLADGTSSAPAGLALVGERGPELVQMGGGERVYNNREFSEMLNTNNVSSSVERMNAVNSTTQKIVANNMMAQRVNTEKSTEIMEKLADGTNINVTGKAPVVLKLDNRELAKSVVEIIGDNVRPRSAI